MTIRRHYCIILQSFFTSKQHIATVALCNAGVLTHIQNKYSGIMGTGSFPLFLNHRRNLIAYSSLGGNSNAMSKFSGLTKADFMPFFSKCTPIRRILPDSSRLNFVTSPSSIQVRCTYQSMANHCTAFVRYHKIVCNTINPLIF